MPCDQTRLDAEPGSGRKTRGRPRRWTSSPTPRRRTTRADSAQKLRHLRRSSHRANANSPYTES